MMQPLSLTESLQSKRNRLFLKLRSTLRFQRGHYQENGITEAGYSAFIQSCNEEQRNLLGYLENKYPLSRWRSLLTEESYKKNLATLHTLDQFFHAKAELPINMQILEAGCQDFSRLPALEAFFQTRSLNPDITGLELDPFPILDSFHSRADKASYYISHSLVSADYNAGDFFNWQAQYDFVICFYPFVSPHPALAWGIPADYGNAHRWMESLQRTLKPGGFALLVHQGDWEEEAFDKARNSQDGLRLIHRKIVDCPLYPMPHPPHASLYRKDSSSMLESLEWKKNLQN